MKETYGLDIMGEIAKEIYMFHKDANRMYTLCEDADKIYQEVVAKYNKQYNRKWGHLVSSDEDDMLSSQDTAEIQIRSKAEELVGRLSVILWIYTRGRYLV